MEHRFFPSEAEGLGFSVGGLLFGLLVGLQYAAAGIV